MYIIAGLGNPGDKYKNTRHNIGYDMIDALSDRYGIDVSSLKFNGVCGTGMIEGVKVLLLKPLTFMNLSGDSIVPALNYYRAEVENELLVFCDDINLAPGSLRIREKGSDGGHNGLKNIIARTGSNGFTRMRFGVGEKPKGYDLADWVLGHFSPEDRRHMNEAMDAALEAVPLILSGQTGKAMSLYNRTANADE